MRMAARLLERVFVKVHIRAAWNKLHNMTEHGELSSALESLIHLTSTGTIDSIHRVGSSTAITRLVVLFIMNAIVMHEEGRTYVRSGKSNCATVQRLCSLLWPSCHVHISTTSLHVHSFLFLSLSRLPLVFCSPFLLSPFAIGFSSFRLISPGQNTSSSPRWSSIPFLPQGCMFLVQSIASSPEYPLQG